MKLPRHFVILSLIVVQLAFALAQGHCDCSRGDADCWNKCYKDTTNALLSSTVTGTATKSTGETASGRPTSVTTSTKSTGVTTSGAPTTTTASTGSHTTTTSKTTDPETTETETTEPKTTEVQETILYPTPTPTPLTPAPPLPSSSKQSSLVNAPSELPSASDAVSGEGAAGKLSVSVIGSAIVTFGATLAAFF